MAEYPKPTDAFHYSMDHAKLCELIGEREGHDMEQAGWLFKVFVDNGIVHFLGRLHPELINAEVA